MLVGKLSKNIFMEEVKNSNIENQMDNILAGC